MAGNLSPGTRKGTWRLRVGMTDPVTGRHRNLSRTVEARTKTEARALLDRFVAEVRNGDQAATNTTVDTLLDRWLALNDGRLSPTTLYTYAGYLRRNVRPYLGSVPVAELGAEHLDKLYLALDHQGLEPASIRQVHAILRRALGQAERWGWIARNPARHASPPPARHTDLEPPSAEAVGRLLAAARETDGQLGRFLLVAAVTGARRGELCGLRWDDVDLDSPAVRIRRAVVDIAGQVAVKDTKTHAARTVALPGVAVAALAEQRRMVEDRLAEAGLAGTAPGWVFVAPRSAGGEPWRPDQVTGAFRRVASQVGVDCRLHDLRHYAATAAITAGVDVRTVAGRLGHADATTTLRVYSHFIHDADRHAADVIANSLEVPQ